MKQFLQSRHHQGIQRSFGRLCAGLLLLAVTVGCDSTSELQRTLNKNAMEYEKHPTNYNLTALAHSYGELLNAQVGDTVRPGFFAEYGVALAQLGKNSEANRMFNNEVMLYPNSARYVRQLKLQLVPEYISDSVADTSTIYIIELDSDYPSTPELQGEQDATIDKETMKILRAKEKEQRELNRAAAQKAKKKAKKEAEKQKKAAAKQKAKEKEALRKEQQRQREAAREQRARERAAARQRDNDEE